MATRCGTGASPTTATGSWWPSIARNKRSVVADLRTDRRARARALASRGACDVIVENFRPGRLVEFGLDYDTARADNPGVIVVHVSGFGQTGPRAEEAGFGSIGEAVGGIRHTTGDPDRPPARCGISLGDCLAALFAVIGTLAALHERSTERQGTRGRRRDLRSGRRADGVDDGRLRDRRRRARPQRRRAAGRRAGRRLPDRRRQRRAHRRQRRLACSPASATPWASPTSPSDPRFATHAARGTNAMELDDLIARWTSTLDAEDLLTRLGGARGARPAACTPRPTW